MLRILIQQLSFDFENFDKYKVNIIELPSIPKVLVVFLVGLFSQTYILVGKG